MQTIERMTVPIDTDLCLEVESLDLGGELSARAWLIHHGEAVAFASYLLSPDATHPLLLNTIEVRRSRRGQGWAREVIAQVEAHTGQTMWTSGHFTALGHAALAAHLPLLPGCTAEVSEPDQTFVANWRRRKARRGL